MLSVIFIIFLCLFAWLVIFVGFAARGNQENQNLLEDIGQSKLLLESIIIEANLRQWLNDYDEHRDVKPIQICITRYKPPGFDSTPLIADILSLI